MHSVLWMRIECNALFPGSVGKGVFSCMRVSKDYLVQTLVKSGPGSTYRDSVASYQSTTCGTNAYVVTRPPELAQGDTSMLHRPIFLVPHQ